MIIRMMGPYNNIKPSKFLLKQYFEIVRYPPKGEQEVVWLSKIKAFNIYIGYFRLTLYIIAVLSWAEAVWQRVT